MPWLAQTPVLAWALDAGVLAQTPADRSVIGDVLALLLWIYLFILIIRVLLSWVPQPPEPLLPLVRGVHRVTDPVVEPLRRRLPPLRIGSVALDLSVIIVLVLIRYVLLPITYLL